MSVDYGQDAPGLLRAFLIGGISAGLLASLAAITLPGVWAASTATLLGIAAVYLIGMAGLMVYESRIGKVKDRDALLARLPWRGDEQVLDVGCGRGLMLIGAAERLSTGHATGIDLWKAEDQAQNSPGDTMANARAMGVADRISVMTADMVTLPFDAGTFDIILTAWAVHNLPDADQRKLALAEMLRVLKPGGVLSLTDIEGRDAYQAALAGLDAKDIRLTILHPAKDRVISALSFGSFAPFTVTARKAA